MSTGRFVWYDLMCTAPANARAFYAGLFGWDLREHGPDYFMIHVHGQPIGGLVPTKPNDNVPNHWIAYVTTDDLPGTLARVREQGGRVYMQKAVDNLGEFAVIADRQGAVISPFHWLHEQPRDAAVAKAANFISWAELHTPDPDDALRFYQGLFGWKSETWGGDYHMVGDEHNAGIMKGGPGVPPHWLLYVNVADADATVENAKEHGARVLVGPQDLQHVGRFAVLEDPTGATFAVMQSFRRD